MTAGTEIWTCNFLNSPELTTRPIQEVQPDVKTSHSYYTILQVQLLRVLTNAELAVKCSGNVHASTMRWCVWSPAKTKALSLPEHHHGFLFISIVYKMLSQIVSKTISRRSRSLLLHDYLMSFILWIQHIRVM